MSKKKNLWKKTPIGKKLFEFKKHPLICKHAVREKKTEKKNKTFGKKLNEENRRKKPLKKQFNKKLNLIVKENKTQFFFQKNSKKKSNNFGKKTL